MAALPATGQTVSAARKQVELSMVVTGTVDIDADGRVEHYALDEPGKLPPAIVQLVSANLPTWKFVPELANGKAADVHAKMSLRFVAKPNGEGDYKIGVRSASFFGGSNAGSGVSIASRPQTDALQNALRMAGTTGDVYLALKIGPDGKLMDGVVQQVNLTMVGTGAQMTQARKFLGQGALDFARHCTYSLPTYGSMRGKPYWVGVLPFRFSYQGRLSEDYGQWHAYVPGPRTEIPWQDPDRASLGVDAAPVGAFTLDGDGPRLLTPLTQG